MTEDEQLYAPREVPITRERYEALARAFDYLLAQTSCGCGRPDQINVVHDVPCIKAVAVNMAADYSEPG